MRVSGPGCRKLGMGALNGTTDEFPPLASDRNWPNLAQAHRSLLGNEAGERLGDFIIPHLVKELPPVWEDEVPVEGRKGLSVG